MSTQLETRCRVIRLPQINDDRGSLCVVDAATHLPFAVARVFWVFDVPVTAWRARHAHREQHEFIIAARGLVTVEVEDGEMRGEFVLDSPDKGLFVPEMVWVELRDFSPDALCLCLASGPYLEDENLRSYDEYRRVRGRSSAVSGRR
jgi:hypothetical protein